MQDQLSLPLLLATSITSLRIIVGHDDRAALTYKDTLGLLIADPLLSVSNYYGFCRLPASSINTTTATTTAILSI